MNRIRKGDEVVVTAGRSKGQRGHVLRVVGEKVLVENVNMVKKHQKPNPSLNRGGGIVEKESPIHQSNVMLYNPGTGKGDRVSYKTLEDGRKVRIFKSTSEAVDI
jgi:large subunit ribosomal protein L24